ncbi:hypothetical protein BDN70DRAFT_991463 [Pholiota conissans]|uniref:Uncharacterized protein n=1 Tax=Pholiota conissans TaxID=109636 RepID=A0A9P6CVN8_9AGAR|nr:hypothetical protein BDN70DRAFT_991463 [Pholiota conissans]
MHSQPASPVLVKKVKKDIIREAKDEEHQIKDAIKDLSRTEKAAQKASKEVAKADSKLEKAENAEQACRTDHEHDVAIAQVQQAQTEFELSSQRHAQLHYDKIVKAAEVDAALMTNDANTKERNVKLNALRGPSATNEAGRVIPVTENQGVDVRMHFT